MLIYKLLSTGLGVLRTRTPHGMGKNIRFSVEGAEAGDRLVFTRSDDKTIYRTLENGCCKVDAALLYGSISVTLLRSGGAAISCEGIFCEDIDGVRMVMPADMELPGRVVQLEIQGEAVLALQKQLSEQQQTIEKLTRGFLAMASWIRVQEEKGELCL